MNQFCDHIIYDADTNKNVVTVYRKNECYICKKCGKFLSDYEYTSIFERLAKMMNKEIPYDSYILYKVSNLMTKLN